MNHRAAGGIASLATIMLLLGGTMLVLAPQSSVQGANATGPSLDGVAHSSVNLGTTSSVSLTTNNPDLVIVFVGVNEAGGSASVEGVSSPDLSFHQRATGSANSMYLEEWYAVGAAALSAETITVTLTAESRFTVMAFAISGANSATVFDPSNSVGPGGCCGSTGGLLYGTIDYTNAFSTSNPDDLILAYTATQGNPIFTVDPSLTLGDQVMVGSWMASAWGYTIVSTPQIGQQYSLSSSVGEMGITFVDAIMLSSSTSTTSTSSSSSTSVSSSSSTTSSTTTTSTSTLQAGSNRNYFMMNNGAYLQDVTATMVLTDQLSGVSAGQYGGNWSLQLNAYSPNGYGAAFTQFVISYSRGSMLPDVESYSSTGTFLGIDVLPSGNIPSSMLTTGTQVSITALTNSTGGVVGASFGVVTSNGDVLWNESAGLGSFPYLEAPIVGVELILVGYGGGSQSIATFTQADGAFQFQAAGPLFWTSTFPGNFPWVQYKANGASESSNILYGVPQQEASNVVAQSFGTTITSTTTSTSTTSTTTTTTTTTTTSSTTSGSSTSSTITSSAIHRHRKF